MQKQASRTFYYIPFFIIAVLFFSSCAYRNIIKTPERNASAMSGDAFYKQVAAYNWQQRDSVAVQEILSGNLPSFLKKFVAVHVSVTDSMGHTNRAIFYVSPDYISIGSNSNWTRVPLTPMAAQRLADSFDCFLPTRKMVDDIYKEARVKLEPVPMYAFRDSSPTMYQHHLIIEGQRKGRKGLIAGIKKDVVLTSQLTAKQNHVAIYGWHQLSQKPIQPLYTGHINWYVDYSHGIRLVYRKIKVNGRLMDYMDVLKSSGLRNLLCNEQYCDFYKYRY